VYKNKHLSLEERLIIERELRLSRSFKSISKLIDKDCTTISRKLKIIIKLKILVPMEKLLITAFIEITAK